MNTIQGMQPVRNIELTPLSSAGNPGGAKPVDFRSVLQNTIQQVEGSSANAQEMVRQFLSGEAEDLHTVALATQRAELQFELFQQMKNKVVQAYQEIMRTQL